MVVTYLSGGYRGAESLMNRLDGQHWPPVTTKLGMHCYTPIKTQINNWCNSYPFQYNCLDNRELFKSFTTPIYILPKKLNFIQYTFLYFNLRINTSTLRSKHINDRSKVIQGIWQSRTLIMPTINYHSDPVGCTTHTHTWYLLTE